MKTQITNIIKERGTITTDPMNIKKDNKGILWRTPCPQIWQPRRHGTSSWKIQSIKNYIKRNRQSRQDYVY